MLRKWLELHVFFVHFENARILGGFLKLHYLDAANYSQTAPNQVSVCSMTRSSQTITYDWPPILETGRAAEYCGVGPSRIRHALRDGDLRAVGRRGGRGPHTFTRTELDRWMRGEPIKSTSDNEATDG